MLMPIGWDSIRDWVAAGGEKGRAVVDDPSADGSLLRQKGLSAKVIVSVNHFWLFGEGRSGGATVSRLFLSSAADGWFGRTLLGSFQDPH